MKYVNFFARLENSWNKFPWTLALRYDTQPKSTQTLCVGNETNVYQIQHIHVYMKSYAEISHERVLI